MLLGWRPHDLDTMYLPFLAGVGTAVGVSDPVFMRGQGQEVMTESQQKFPLDMAAHREKVKQGDAQALRDTKLGIEWLKETNSGIFKTWEQLKLLRDNWEGPIVLKGIQCVDDAHRAMEAGMNGIIVSNHGGRQVDGAIPSFVALESICADGRVRRAQKSGDFTVLFDSGIRTGTDVIKAIAMGAQGVLGKSTCSPPILILTPEHSCTSDDVRAGGGGRRGRRTRVPRFARGYRGHAWSEWL